MNAVHVYMPAATLRALDIGVCPDCKKSTRFLSFFIPWMGWDTTCLRCGRQWQDNEWCALPFIRGSRQKNIDAAKERWRTVGLDVQYKVSDYNQH